MLALESHRPNEAKLVRFRQLFGVHSKDLVAGEQCAVVVLCCQKDDDDYTSYSVNVGAFVLEWLIVDQESEL